MVNQIKEIFAENEIKLSDRQCEQFVFYARFLREYNEKVNLTAITEPKDIIVKHFLDSALPLSSLDEFKTLADIGTGAGFPGIVMAIMRPESKVTLIEANGKKITFLQELIAKLQLENVKTVQGRSEDLARGELREAFEVVTARAVAALPALAEYCLPFVKEGGIFIALKGGSEKYEDGAAAVEELGGDLEDFAEYTLPGGDLRRIFIIEKISKTPKKYPRSNALIKKTPLR